MDKEQLNDIIKVYKLLGLINQDIDLDSFIYKYNHPREYLFSLNLHDIIEIIIIFILIAVLLGSALVFIGIRKQWILTKTNLRDEIKQQKLKIDEQNRTIMAQSKMTAIGEMISNIAHQWRQPLNIISLNTSKLETAILLNIKISNEDISHISESINQQSQYLSNTIDDFRNYFSADADSMELFKLTEVIENLDGLTKDMFHHNNIEAVAGVGDCSIIQNKSLLVQALLNIYNNAKDVIIDNKIKHKYFFINVQCNKNNIVIKLKDSGGGVDEKTITKIFEPYYTTKEQSKGTGLGLYITYEIVTKHLFGTIEVENKDYVYKNKKLMGAEFTITLPMIS
ncbi:MAG: HAMP domain-containing histidine kinase [Sulfurimonas sp.]|nr:HAMP domain-containing histidine kinase [Sulfurimonas sp.]